MLKLQKTNPFVRYEKVRDFSKESEIISIQGYYMKSTEIVSKRNISLYVMMEEEITIIYNLTVSSSDWVRDNLKYKMNENLITLSKEFMYKFDLVRVIPEGGIKPFHSFLRVMLKRVPDNARLYSIEEEMYGDDWEQQNARI